jgi:hypothetical protein
MGAKGTSRNCCCDGCSTPPFTRTIPGVFHSDTFAQLFCCACVPFQLCVEYQCGYESTFGLLSLAQVCNGDETQLNSYTGKIVANGAVATIHLYFLVDPDSHECSLCLTSDELGIYPDVCVTLTDDIRALLCSTCQTCFNKDSPPIVEFSFPTAACGGTTATISLRRAANTSLIPVPRAAGCPDLCDEPYAADPYADLAACAGRCGGCNCICTNAKLIVIRDNVGDGGGGAALCGGSWTFPGDWQVSIVPGENNCCALALTRVGNTHPEVAPAPVPVGVLTGNPCPNPVAEWTYHDKGDYTASGQVTVYFQCAGCGDEALSATGNPCCPQPMPRVLKCEVIFAPPCMCPDLGTVDVLFDLFLDIPGALWIGEWDNPANCNDPPPPYTEVSFIKVAVGCPSVGGGMSCHLVISSVAIDQIAFDYGGTCEPVDFEFTYNGVFHGPECGNGLGGSLPWTATVRITV